MRIRSIRPEFWASEDVAAMSWDTRLIFIGLWSYVDDNGVGRDVERLIVAALFPLDEDFPEASRRVTGALRHLSDHGQITRYVVDGKAYLHITAWSKHQRIEKASKGRYPAPTCGNAEIREDSPTTPVPVPEMSPPGEGEKGRRGEGEKGTTSPRKRGTRLPESFAPTEDLVLWAKENAPNAGMRDHEAFMDYWTAQPGAKGVKTDWDATWRNWMRRASDDRPGAPKATFAPPKVTTQPEIYEDENGVFKRRWN